jgi:hypothetical protein
LFQSLLSQILFILLSGENPGTKATAAAFPQSVRPLRCLSGKSFYNLFKTTKRNSLYIQYSMDQLCLPMDLEEDALLLFYDLF